MFRHYFTLFTFGILIFCFQSTFADNEHCHHFQFVPTDQVDFKNEDTGIQERFYVTHSALETFLWQEQSGSCKVKNSPRVAFFQIGPGKYKVEFKITSISIDSGNEQPLVFLSFLNTNVICRIKLHPSHSQTELQCETTAGINGDVYKYSIPGINGRFQVLNQTCEEIVTFDKWETVTAGYSGGDFFLISGSIDFTRLPTPTPQLLETTTHSNDPATDSSSEGKTEVEKLSAGEKFCYFLLAVALGDAQVLLALIVSLVYNKNKRDNNNNQEQSGAPEQIVSHNNGWQQFQLRDGKNNERRDVDPDQPTLHRSWNHDAPGPKT